MCAHHPVSRPQGVTRARCSAPFVCFLVLTAVAPIKCAVLLLVPLASDSHIAAFTALSTALEHHGGHEVHVVVTEGLVDAARAMAAARNASHRHTYLTYPLRYELFPQDMAAMAKANSVRAMFIGFKVLAAMTDMVIGDTQLLQDIHDLQPDLIIGDATASFGHWLSGLTGIPSIEFDVGTSSGLLHGLYGGVFNPAYVPAPGTLYPSNGMTLKQRCYNTAVTLLMRSIVHISAEYGPIRALATRRDIQHLPGTGPHRPLLLLVNFDWSLEPPRPIGPSTKYLGPLMPQPPKQLPVGLEAWLEGTQPQHGASKAAPNSLLPVIYVSFGASFVAPEAALPAVATAVAAARRKMRFIISMKAAEQQLLKAAWEQGAVDITAHEVLLQERVPQNDLLAHQAVAVFVTQGGYLSMQEAAYHSVPVISIPLSLGQEEISQYAVDQGRGLLVRKETLLAGSAGPLLKALLDMVDNHSNYKAQAQLVAHRLKAHPRSAGQQAADWVGYALANPRGSGSFLHTQGQDLPWWQVLLLDVAAVYAAGVLAAMAMLWMLTAALCAPRSSATGPNEHKDLKAAGPRHNSVSTKASKAE